MCSVDATRLTAFYAVFAGESSLLLPEPDAKRYRWGQPCHKRAPVALYNLEAWRLSVLYPYVPYKDSGRETMMENLMSILLPTCDRSYIRSTGRSDSWSPLGKGVTVRSKQLIDSARRTAKDEEPRVRSDCYLAANRVLIVAISLQEREEVCFLSQREDSTRTLVLCMHPTCRWNTDHVLQSPTLPTA